MGSFSFDPVKTITCGEGGAIITDDEALYLRADYHADHGHDHVAADRGLDDHPILGNNFRISELQAAVGLAQLRKLDLILEKQRAHKKVIKEALQSIQQVSFREIPDESGDTATFLTYFMPTASAAIKTVQGLSEAGIGGCFYWFDNKWHYLRKWDHFKTLKAAAKLPVQLLDHLPDYEKIELPQSDEVLSRAVCMLIPLSLTPEAIQQRAETTVATVKKFI
jgi:8-amino-3,8-dideoxy-alpha-D-manno-octulosonate transaminase